VVDEFSRQQKEQKLNKIFSSRNWSSKRLTGEKARQAGRLLKSGVLSEQDRTLDSRGRLRWMGEIKGDKDSLSLTGEWILASRRPLPNFH
jgi:hypothetical protein